MALSKSGIASDGILDGRGYVLDVAGIDPRHRKPAVFGAINMVLRVMSSTCLGDKPVKANMPICDVMCVVGVGAGWGG